MNAECPHAERVEGKCVACGDCTHELILNGACYACGATEFDRPLFSKQPDEQVVPLDRLRKPR